MERTEALKEAKRDRAILKRIHGSLKDIPLWEVQKVVRDYPELTGREVYRLFGR